MEAAGGQDTPVLLQTQPRHVPSPSFCVEVRACTKRSFAFAVGFYHHWDSRSPVLWLSLGSEGAVPAEKHYCARRSSRLGSFSHLCHRHCTGIHESGRSGLPGPVPKLTAAPAPRNCRSEPAPPPPPRFLLLADNAQRVQEVEGGLLAAMPRDRG